MFNPVGPVESETHCMFSRACVDLWGFPSPGAMGPAGSQCQTSSRCIGTCWVSIQWALGAGWVQMPIAWGPSRSHPHRIGTQMGLHAPRVGTHVGSLPIELWPNWVPNATGIGTHWIPSRWSPVGFDSVETGTGTHWVPIPWVPRGLKSKGVVAQLGPDSH